jgi:hypothetical protein
MISLVIICLYVCVSLNKLFNYRQMLEEIIEEKDEN